MGYERYSNDSNQGGYYNPEDNAGDYGRDYGSGRDYSYSSARQYAASGEYDRGRLGSGYGRDDQQRGDRGGYGQQGGQGGNDRGSYGPREYGNGGYANRDRFGGGQQDQQRGYGGGDYGNRGGQADWDRGGGDGRSWGRDRWGGGDRFQGRQQQGDGDRFQGRQQQGGGNQDRGFFDRAGDEVRSWFGDDDAGRRREQDARQDQRAEQHHDDDYHHWRRGQIDALDRDYAEYRQESRSKFASEFGTWRTGRQAQRDLLGKVKEHMDVVGSDGTHVGTVDHIRDDRILLTKNDQDAGGRHHSIPSSWIETVDDKVTLRKTADEAHSHWRDEERNQAMFGNDQQRSGGSNAGATASSTGAASGGNATAASGSQATDGHLLNKSFSGTY